MEGSLTPPQLIFTAPGPFADTVYGRHIHMLPEGIYLAYSLTGVEIKEITDRDEKYFHREVGDAPGQ